MPITFVAAGTTSKVASGTMTPGLPAGWAADDIHILLAVSQNNDPVAVANYTTIYNNQNNDGGVQAQPAIFWRRAVAGDAAPSVTGAASGSMSTIVGFRGCTVSGTPYNNSTENLPAVSLTATWTGLTPGSAADMIVAAVCMEAPFGAPSVSGYSGTNPTFTEGLDDFNTLGASWTGIAMAYGLSNDGSATGTRTATISTVTGAVYGAYLLALTQAGGGQGAFVPPWRPHVGPNPARQGGWFAFMGSQYVPPAPAYLDPLIFGGAL